MVSFVPAMLDLIVYLCLGHLFVAPVILCVIILGIQAGGETVFPKVAPTASQAAHQEASAAARREVSASGALGDVSSWESKMTQECGSRFAVPPKKGDALLFYSQVKLGYILKHECK